MDRIREAVEEYAVAKRHADFMSDKLREFRSRQPYRACGNDHEPTRERLIVEREEQAAQRLGVR